MRQVHRQIRVDLLDFVELPTVQKDLILLARDARKNAQAPYSHFKVGAAVLSESGEMYRGCNWEDAGLRLTTHAEHCSILHLTAHEGPQKILAIAVVAAPGNLAEIDIVNRAPEHRNVIIDELCIACAQCCQAAWENSMADPNVTLLGWMPWGEIARTTIRDAYPMRFGPESLGVDVKRDSK
ncbi:MAG: hypothetical protein WEC39_01005 [Patescibacteria group bacterium]